MAKRRSKGDGSIYFDEKRNVYVGQITLGYDEHGNRKRKTIYGSTKTDVKAKLKNVEYQVYTGTFIDKNYITIYHLAKQILDEKLNQNEIQEQTYYRHIETLKILKPIYNTPLQSATETQLKNYFSNYTLNYSASVIEKIYAMLGRIFKEAYRRKIISENPMENVKKPRSKKQNTFVRALTKEEQKRLINVLQTKDINYSQQMLISLLLGLRMGEINALHVEDVNFIFGRLTVQRTIARGQKGEAILNNNTKTNAGRRTLTMTETVQRLLRECIGDKTSGLIFTHNNRMITTSQVNAQFGRALKKYNVLDKNITEGKIDLHSLRHTFGTRCAEAGMPPKVLQEIMGHTDIKITMNTYFYATGDYMKDNVIKVDNILKNEGLSIEYPTTDFNDEFALKNQVKVI